MILFHTTLIRVLTRSPEYIIVCLIILLIIGLLSWVFKKSPPPNAPDKGRAHLNEPLMQKRLTINETFTQKPEKLINTLQDLFVIDLAKIPDQSFKFIADVNLAKSIFVKASKKLHYMEADLFEDVNVNVFDDGNLNIQFSSYRYECAKNEQLKNFLMNLYKIYGADDNGKLFPSASKLAGLKTYTPIYDSVTWQDHNISFIISKELNFSFQFSPPNKQIVINLYYTPYAKRSKNGLLLMHEHKLNNTEASLLIDDFTKRRSIILTNVAGIENERYIYTYTLHDNFTTNLSSLTKLGLSFTYSNGFFFLHLISFDKDFQLAKDDNIIFLFHDDITLTATCATAKAVDSSGTYRNVTHLLYNDMKNFATKKLVKWKITSVRKAVFQVGGPVNNMYITQYKGEEEGQYLLQVIAKKLIQCVILNEGNSFNETSPELLGFISE